MRRWTLLLAGAALWLFLAAIPALADGGPHVAAMNSGASTLTADSCAGCHRAHTAQGQFLITAPDEETLCLTCHGATANGATTDVVTGVQYVSGAQHNVAAGAGTQLGALRNGGFEQARIATSNPARITYYRSATDISTRPRVGVGTAQPVTSAHLDLDGSSGSSVTAKGIAWGNGAAGSGVGATLSVPLECTSCHNPHGNGQYRILNDLPAVTGTGFVDPVVISISGVSATTDRFTTADPHSLVVGDLVTIKGVGATVTGESSFTDGTYIVKSVAGGVAFTVAKAPTKTTLDITGSALLFSTDSTGGTVARYAAIVDDAPLPTIAGDMRNYTVTQVRGYQGNPLTYLLYASSIADATSGTYPFVADIVGVSVSFDFLTPIGVVTNAIWTGLPHGFAQGDSVTIAGLSTYGVADATYTISDIPSSNTFVVSGPTISSNYPTAVVPGVGAKIGTATKSMTGMTVNAAAGDYFHRTVPWAPSKVNAACPNDVFVDSTVNPELASACLTAFDAPNGRPATVSGKLKIRGVTDAITPSAFGQVSFNDQISAWCSTCHSRYYQASFPNPGSEPGSSADLPRTIASVSSGDDSISVGVTVPASSPAITSSGFSVGDRVQFSGTTITPDLTGGTWWVVSASSTSKTFKVSATYDGPVVNITAGSAGGTVTRLYPFSASGWWFPRPGDSLYKYQHATGSNRGCTTCHVSHGSNALMPGDASSGTTYSGTVAYPGGTAPTAGYNSRLLKVDNRGTCQLCHDPTGTREAGEFLPLGGTQPTVP